MSQPIDRPAPGSHDRSVPSGSMEESSANLFDAMLAARAAEERGERGPLHAFYRTLMNGTLLLPVPARARRGGARSARIGDQRRRAGRDQRDARARERRRDRQRRLRIVRARWPHGRRPAAAISRFPRGSRSRTWPPPACRRSWIRPDRCRTASGPTSWRRSPRAASPAATSRCYEPTTRSSIRVRPPGTDTRDLERRLAGELDPTGVEAAYLVETDSGNGDRRLMLGLVGEPGTSATVDVPDGTDVVWLEEPLLAQVRAVADPFHRRGRGR